MLKDYSAKFRKKKFFLIDKNVVQCLYDVFIQLKVVT